MELPPRTADLGHYTSLVCCRKEVACRGKAGELSLVRMRVVLVVEMLVMVAVVMEVGKMKGHLAKKMRGMTQQMGIPAAWCIIVGAWCRILWDVRHGCGAGCGGGGGGGGEGGGGDAGVCKETGP